MFLFLCCYEVNEIPMEVGLTSCLDVHYIQIYDKVGILIQSAPLFHRGYVPDPQWMPVTVDCMEHYIVFFPMYT